MNRSLETALSYFDSEKQPRHPFDHWYRGYHNGSEATERTKQQVCVAITALLETVGDRPLLYKPDSISSGYLAHREVVRWNNDNPTKNALKTVRKLENTISGPLVKTNVLEPNTRNNILRANIFQAVYHDEYVVIEPIFFESATRIQAEERGFSQGQKWEEEDYMGLWFPLVDIAKATGLDGDWNFSRNGIWEVMRGTIIQAGLIPTRPDADMEFLDINKNPITLLDRAQKITDYLMYTLHHGFHPKEGATALAEIFSLDTWLRNGKAEGSAAGHFDIDRVHPMLRDRSEEELAGMDSLRKKMENLLIGQCADYIVSDDLDPKLQKKIEKRRGETPPRMPAWVSTEAERVEREMEMLVNEERVNKLDVIHLPAQRRYHPEEMAFESKARTFEDGLHNKCGEGGRLSTRFVLGAMEIPMPAADVPYTALVLGDPKCNSIALDVAQQAGVDDVRLLPGVLKKKFDAAVRLPALKKIEDFQAKLLKENPLQLVVSTANIARINEAVNGFNNLVTAPGGGHWGSMERNALVQKYLDRNPERVYFLEGWESSDSYVQHMVRAVMIQAGFFDRPSGENVKLSIYEIGNPEEELSLYEITEKLAAHVENMIDKGLHNFEDGPTIQEPALALARLFHIHDMIAVHLDSSVNFDPATKKSLVNLSNTHPGLTSYWRDSRLVKMQKLRQKFVGTTAVPGQTAEGAARADAQGLLMKHCAQRIDKTRLREGELPAGYIHQHRKNYGEEKLRKSRRSMEGSDVRMKRDGILKT